jgi:hypothetical protein
MKYKVNDYFAFQANLRATKEFTYTLSKYLECFNITCDFNLDNGLINFNFNENIMSIVENKDGNKKMISIIFFENALSPDKKDFKPSLSIVYDSKSLSFELVIRSKEKEYYRIDTIKFDGDPKNTMSQPVKDKDNYELYYLCAICEYFSQSIDIENLYHHQIALYDKKAIKQMKISDEAFTPTASNDIEAISIKEIEPITLIDLVLFNGGGKTMLGEFSSNDLKNVITNNSNGLLAYQLDEYCHRFSYHGLENLDERIRNVSYIKEIKRKKHYY